MILVIAAAMLALVLVVPWLIDRDRASASGSADGDRLARLAYGEARAAQVSSARLKAQVDELELRLKLVESQTGYTALDGTRLPAVNDLLVPPPPPPRDPPDRLR